jgi:hypothetical protein
MHELLNALVWDARHSFSNAARAPACAFSKTCNEGDFLLLIKAKASNTARPEHRKDMLRCDVGCNLTTIWCLRRKTERVEEPAFLLDLCKLHDATASEVRHRR